MKPTNNYHSPLSNTIAKWPLKIYDTENEIRAQMKVQIRKLSSNVTGKIKSEFLNRKESIAAQQNLNENISDHPVTTHGRIEPKQKLTKSHIRISRRWRKLMTILNKTGLWNNLFSTHAKPLHLIKTKQRLIKTLAKTTIVRTCYEWDKSRHWNIEWELHD